MALKDLGGIVAVNGPGSFTGVRVGLSAVKGFAEASQIGVVPISRLQVLSRKSGVPACALDAHRGEVFLRVEELGKKPRELLAGARELAAISPRRCGWPFAMRLRRRCWRRPGQRRNWCGVTRRWQRMRCGWARRGWWRVAM